MTNIGKIGLFNNIIIPAFSTFQPNNNPSKSSKSYGDDVFEHEQQVNEPDVCEEPIMPGQSPMEAPVICEPKMPEPTTTANPGICEVPIMPEPFSTEESVFQDSECTNSTNNQISYVLRDQEQLDNLIFIYRSNIKKLSPDDIKYYDKFITDYKKSAETQTFKKNIEAKKAFLALKKLDKYKYDTSIIPAPEPGRLNENSELLGQYSNDFNDLILMAKYDNKFNNASNNLYKQLYLSDSAYCCLLDDDRDAVQAEARKMLEEEDKKYSDNIEDTYIIRPDYIGSYTYINDIDNEWNNWNVQIIIKDDCEGKENQYLPQDLVTIHELYHAKQTTPGKSENNKESRFSELGAVIDSAVRSDEIHKKLNNIPMDEIVEYPKTFKTTSGEEINLGQLVNEFRAIKEENYFENWEQVFTSEQGSKLIKDYFG